jgi:hypothetical protein
MLGICQICFWVVPFPVIQHPRVPSSTSLVEICGRCRELLPTMVVTPTCMPRFHTSQVWGMVRCSKVIAFLSLQTSLRPSLMKPSSAHDLQPQTVKVGVSCLHSSLGVTLRLLSYLVYDVPLLWPHQHCLDQIYLSLLAQSNWAMCSIVIHIMPRMVPFSNFLDSCCCMKIQPTANSCPNYLDIPSCKLWAYPLEFGLLSQFSHPSVGDRLNYESGESRGTRTVAPKSKW